MFQGRSKDIPGGLERYQGVSGEFQEVSRDFKGVVGALDGGSEEFRWPQEMLEAFIGIQCGSTGFYRRFPWMFNKLSVGFRCAPVVFKEFHVWGLLGVQGVSRELHCFPRGLETFQRYSRAFHRRFKGFQKISGAF